MNMIYAVVVQKESNYKPIDGTHVISAFFETNFDNQFNRGKAMLRNTCANGRQVRKAILLSQAAACDGQMYQYTR